MNQQYTMAVERDDSEHDDGQLFSANWKTQWRTAIVEGKRIPHDSIVALPLAACRLGGAFVRLPKTLHYITYILQKGRRHAV